MSTTSSTFLFFLWSSKRSLIRNNLDLKPGPVWYESVEIPIATASVAVVGSLFDVGDDDDPRLIEFRDIIMGDDDEKPSHVSEKATIIDAAIANI